jgi:hypothetical protein
MKIFHRNSHRALCAACVCRGPTLRGGAGHASIFLTWNCERRRGHVHFYDTGLVPRRCRHRLQAGRLAIKQAFIDPLRQRRRYHAPLRVLRCEWAYQNRPLLFVPNRAPQTRRCRVFWVEELPVYRNARLFRLLGGRAGFPRSPILASCGGRAALRV